MNGGPTLSSLTIALVGCGKMGGAMLRGWLDAGIHHVDILEPGDLPDELSSSRHVTHHKEASTFTGNWDMVVIAVKPQVMKDVCASIKAALSPATPILSIAAGQKIAAFHSYFAAVQPVIRAMPNTPAAVGKAISVACSSAQITPEERSIADLLLHSIGQVAWTDNEANMDAVTAVSGSGPAYVFYLIEALREAGIQAGLDQDLAGRLARQTVIGSAALAEQASTIPAAMLRQNVTSPGGTTEAALTILMDGRLQQIMNDAVEAATKRSKELSA
jgi:pyrroline-5-carboxylate reductase